MQKGGFARHSKSVKFKPAKELYSSNPHGIFFIMRLFLVLLLLFIFPALSIAAPGASEEAQAVLARFRFDGVAYDAKNPAESIVLINAIELHEGDIYRGFKVEQIADTSVVMTDTETKEAYELSIGNGASSVQKAANWDPLKKLSQLKLPAGKPASKAPANGNKSASQKKKEPGPKGDSPFGDGALGKLMEKHPQMALFRETEAKIDKLKTDRDKRDEELGKLFASTADVKLNEE